MNGTFLHEAEAELHELAMMQERLSEAETGEFVSGDLEEVKDASEAECVSGGFA
jgi:hypothetical protein